MNDKRITIYKYHAIYLNAFGMFYAYQHVQDGNTSYFEKRSADTLADLKATIKGWA